jgi:hypothetical protein
MTSSTNFNAEVWEKKFFGLYVNIHLNCPATAMQVTRGTGGIAPTHS